MERPFAGLNTDIHKKLKEVFQLRHNAILTTAEIKRFFESEYKNSDVSWVQPSDHCINMTNKGACWCSKTDKAIFEQIRRGVYKIR